MSENKARLDTGQVSLDIIIGSVFSRVLYVGNLAGEIGAIADIG